MIGFVASGTDRQSMMESPESFAEVEPVRKDRPNHQMTLRILRAMTPQQKLAQVWKLNERTNRLFRAGLRQRYPDVDDVEFEKIYLQMRARCHNRNY